MSAASLFRYERIAIFFFSLFFFYSFGVISAVAAISLVRTYVQKCGRIRKYPGTLDSAQYISHRIAFAIRGIKTVRKPRLEIISVVYAFIMRVYLHAFIIFFFLRVTHLEHMSHLSPEINFNFVKILLKLITH